MEKYEILGLAASFFSTSTLFPQAWKTLKTGETTSLSLLMYSLIVSGCIAWLIYGIGSRSISIVICNLVGVIPAISILSYKIRNSIVKGG